VRAADDLDPLRDIRRKPRRIPGHDPHRGAVVEQVPHHLAANAAAGSRYHDHGLSLANRLEGGSGRVQYTRIRRRDQDRLTID
jgi:hypothetical protein